MAAFAVWLVVWRVKFSIMENVAGLLGLRLIHPPTHASWLNQVEIYFSVVQRKVVTPNDFHCLDEIQARLMAFQRHYQQIATPFEWKFTTDDLSALLDRITAHEDAQQAPAA